MDNEQAMINALSANLPNLQVHLCYFHVCKAIQRWIQRHGLIMFYNEPNSKLKILVGNQKTIIKRKTRQSKHKIKRDSFTTGMMCDLNVSFPIINWNSNKIFVLNDNYG